MTNSTKVFSVMPADPKSLDPADRMVALTAKWRRERNLDDSDESLRLSAIAVMKAEPKLAKQYQRRQMTLAKSRPGEDPWADADEEE